MKRKGEREKGREGREDLDRWMYIGSVYVCDRKREGTLLVCDVKILTKSILEAWWFRSLVLQAKWF